MDGQIFMAPDDTRTDRLTIRIKPALKAALEELAKADRRTLSQFVELVLEERAEAAKPKAKK